MTPRRFLAGLVLALSLGCTQPARLTQVGDSRFRGAAPDSFDVEMVTTKGVMTVRLRRKWGPIAVDRFHNLVRNRFFDGVAFHRTIGNFVAQFGLHGDTAVSEAWRSMGIYDEPVRETNRRGTLAFARSGPQTRSTQLYFNLVDNPRLDTLNYLGFPPIGEIVDGYTVLDALNSEYSGTRGGATLPGPSQDSIRARGNRYLLETFPRLDYIVTARVKRTWGRRS